MKSWQPATGKRLVRARKDDGARLVQPEDLVFVFSKPILQSWAIA